MYLNKVHSETISFSTVNHNHLHLHHHSNVQLDDHIYIFMAFLTFNDFITSLYLCSITASMRILLTLQFFYETVHLYATMQKKCIL